MTKISKHHHHHRYNEVRKFAQLGRSQVLIVVLVILLTFPQSLISKLHHKPYFKTLPWSHKRTALNPTQLILSRSKVPQQSQNWWRQSHLWPKWYCRRITLGSLILQKVHHKNRLKHQLHLKLVGEREKRGDNYKMTTLIITKCDSKNKYINTQKGR